MPDHPTFTKEQDPDQAHTKSLADPAGTTGVDGSPAYASTHLTSAGRYELADEIAHGGMGVIYRATDTVLGREVAVKVLQEKFGSASAAARRFADEAHITAQLQHPAIPPVHDLGNLPDGRPFLAMKLIKGETLEDELANRLDPSQDRGRFITVFEQICQALAYAHDRHVIHRDLKPANVMVGSFGEVQVMDWGLAKVLGLRSDGTVADPDETGSGTEIRSLRDSDGSETQAGSVLGTPAFMPPEQAVGAIGKIDERSDVFGIGAILAVILTGQPPYRGSASETTRVLAARGKVDECFARLDFCGADPELVALCKRCLAPEKENRPRNAGEVAGSVANLRAAADERARQAELERVRLEGERTAAETKSAERRTRRRIVAVAVALFAVAVIGGLTAVLMVQRRANSELANKNNELAAEQAKVEMRNYQLAEEQAKVEARNRQLAEEQTKVQARFELAQKAIAAFYTGVSQDVLLRSDQFRDLQTRLLEDAAGFYVALEKLLEGQPDFRSRRLLANGFFELGSITEKIGSKSEGLASHRKALAIRRELAATPGADVAVRLDVARSLLEVGLLQDAMGNKAGALEAFEEQCAIATTLEAESPSDAVREVLASSHHAIGWVQSRTGKPDLAKHSYDQAVALRQQVVDASPERADSQAKLAWSLLNLANLLSATGRSEEAMAMYERALATYKTLADAHPKVTIYQNDLASSYNNIANRLLEKGKMEDARKYYEKAIAIRQQLVKANATAILFQIDLASSEYNMGLLLTRMAKRDEALAAYERARAIQQKLVDANPSIPEYQRDLAWSYHDTGYVLMRMGKVEDALAAHEKALSIRQILVNANPTNERSQGDLASSHYGIGVILSNKGKLEEALKAHERAIVIRQKLAENNPSIINYQSNLASSFYSIGSLQQKLRKIDEAEVAYGRASAIHQKLADSNPTNTQIQSDLSYSLSMMGHMLWQKGKLKEALVPQQKALGIRQRLADASPSIVHLQSDLGWSYYAIGNLLSRLGKKEESLAAYEKGRNIYQKLVTSHPTDSQHQSSLATIWNHMGDLLSRIGRKSEAIQALEKALAIWQKLVEEQPANSEYKIYLATSYNTIGRHYAQDNRFNEAFAALDKGFAIRKQLVGAEPSNFDYLDHLAFSLAYRGWAHLRAGHPADAAIELRRAWEIWEKDNSMNTQSRFESSRVLSLLTGLGIDPNSGVSAAEAAAFADKAIAGLAEVIKTDWVQSDELNEPDFDPLRTREDFRKLIKELEAKFPREKAVAPPPRTKD